MSVAPDRSSQTIATTHRRAPRAHVRIETGIDDPDALRALVSHWQRRFQRSSGALHPSRPATLLVGADTSVEAIEALLRALDTEEMSIEIVWR